MRRSSEARYRNKVISYLLIGTLSFTSIFSYSSSVLARPDWVQGRRPVISYQVCLLSESEETCRELVEAYKKENQALEEQNQILKDKLKDEMGKDKGSSISTTILLVILGVLTGGLIVAFLK